jgi:hypothetical protein
MTPGSTTELTGGAALEGKASCSPTDPIFCTAECTAGPGTADCPESCARAAPGTDKRMQAISSADKTQNVANLCWIKLFFIFFFAPCSWHRGSTNSFAAR